MDDTFTETFPIKLVRGERVLVIDDDGFLYMEMNNGENGTILELKEYTSIDDMRRRSSINFNSKILKLNQPQKGINVCIDDNGITPYILEKDKFNNNIIGFLNNAFINLTLDDYEGNQPGNIKWWNTTDIGTQRTLKENQWFNTIKV